MPTESFSKKFTVDNQSADCMIRILNSNEKIYLKAKKARIISPEELRKIFCARQGDRLNDR